MRTKIDGIKADLQAWGVTHIKLELEGHVGRSGTRYGDPDLALRYIREQLPAELLDAITWNGLWSDGGDTEYTVTIPVTHIEYAPYFLKAMNSLARECGQGSVYVGSAGMHISVMWTPQYPVQYQPDIHPDQKSLANFKKQVDKMMPYITVLAANGKLTRRFTARNMTVSHHSKYSGVFTHRGTCFEYRIFDTCYDEPERILEHFSLIGRTLRYLNPRAKFKLASFKLNTHCQTEDGDSWRSIREMISQNGLKTFEQNFTKVRPKYLRLETVKQRHF